MAKKRAAGITNSEVKKTARKNASTQTKSKANTADAVNTADEKEILENTEAEEKSEKSALKVLFVSPECRPFASSGGLGEVANSLPTALCAKGVDCRVILPLYERVDQHWRELMKFLGATVVPVTWRQQYMGIFELKYNGVRYYFIDNEYYFKRDELYGYYDDGERFAYFSRAVFEALEIMDFAPDIIHANDWQTALVPVYQNSLIRRSFVKTVFTIHNIEYQGFYSREALDSIVGLPDYENYRLEFEDGINLMKGAMETANAITTVSPTYAAELNDSANAFGLDGIVRRNSHKFHGIINGLDVDTYNPSKDPLIAANYSPDDLSGKTVCKHDLQKIAGLPEADVPVITMVSRLVPAKGVDLIRDTIDAILDNTEAQFIMLGTGYPEYEDFFRGLEQRHRGQCCSMILFNGELSHRIYAGGDILLVPSRSEPCGLTQMIGCRYADIPLVRATGGLADTIQDCSLGNGNGFVFQDFTPDAFYRTVMNALDHYYHKDDWKKLQAYDMSLDFSWDKSSQAYLDLYKTL